MLTRRDLIRSASAGIAAAALPDRIWGGTDSSSGNITRLDIVKYRRAKKTASYLELVSDAGPVGRFGPLGWGIPEQFRAISAKLREFMLGKDALGRELEFLAFWETLYPDHPLAAYAAGIDPLTRKKIWGTTRGERQRHSKTGVVIMTLSAVENALWDLKGKLLGIPVHRLIGSANRRRVPVYTRVGEGRNLDQARKMAREFYDRGCRHQKWYFVYAPSDGEKGMRANLELVRVLREELGREAVLMFDNHSMRYEIGGDWLVSLAKRMLPYDPLWLEEPTAPDDIEGYARVKGETGITVAGGEHHYTRWQIKPLLQRKCLDWVQSDPDWCGGISEWISICDMARKYPGVHVVPHSDHILTNCQCVASQPKSLCPMVEYNSGQTKNKLSFRTGTIEPNKEMLAMPQEPGLGPDIALTKCRPL